MYIIQQFSLHWMFLIYFHIAPPLAATPVAPVQSSNAGHTSNISQSHGHVPEFQLPRWVTGEAPVPELYLQVLEAVVR